jgi:hypothetical protein
MQTKRTSAAGVINPARGALAIISLAVLGGIAVTPAYAFTDINGRVCATSQLIANPTDPNGPSVCPAGSVPVSPFDSPVFHKLLDRVYGRGYGGGYGGAQITLAPSISLAPMTFFTSRHPLQRLAWA